MKKLLFISMVIFALVSCKSYENGEYVVNVSVTGNLAIVASDTIYLSNSLENYPFSDTAVIENGKATFTGTIKTPQNVMVMLMIGDSISANPARLCSFFLEEGETDINANITMADADVKISGGAVQTTRDSLETLREALLSERDFDSLSARFSKMGPEDQQKVQKIYMEVDSIVSAAEQAYIESHPKSLYALDNLWKNFEFDMELDEAAAKLEAFSSDLAFAENEMVKEIESIIAIHKGLQIGATAPDFVQNDPEGEPVKFSDVYSKNKVTMIDFWASWCGPCRRFNPDLVDIYKKYHRKGLEILAVSLDRDGDAWLKAIKDDNLTWKHVSDLGFWSNKVAQQYRIRYIPQNVFVDKEGKIIAKQLSSKEDIIKLLEENL